MTRRERSRALLQRDYRVIAKGEQLPSRLLRTRLIVQQVPANKHYIEEAVGALELRVRPSEVAQHLKSGFHLRRRLLTMTFQVQPSSTVSPLPSCIDPGID